MKRTPKAAPAMTQEKVISILKRESPRLKRDFGVRGIILFGSFAKGTQGRHSDIDLIVDLEKPLGLDFVALAETLEEVLGNRVDVATHDHFKSSFGNSRYKHIAEDIKESMIHVCPE